MMIEFSHMTKIVQTLQHLSLVLLIVSNFLLIAGFVAGKIVLHKTEDAIKFFARFSVGICTLFVIYFVSILCFSIVCLFSQNALYSLIFPVFLFLPFVIGKFSTYEKVHFYTNIQIVTLVISLAIALLIL